jgi:hypothetical protein
MRFVRVVGAAVSVSSVSSVISLVHAVPPKAVPARPATMPIPHTAHGVVKTTAGRPVQGVTVDISGTVTQNGGIVDFDPETGARGEYRQTDLAPGSYTVRAWKSVRYNGATYRLPMSPVQGKIEDRYLSKKGIVRDFVWRVSGPIPSRFFSEDEPNSYYGGSLKIFGADENGLNELALPPGTLLKAILVPDGPLIDGSAGKAIAFEFPFRKGELYQRIEKDIPLGRYTLTLGAVLPDGQTKTIRLYDGSGHDDSDFKTTRTIDFPPSGAAVRPFQTHFVTWTGVSVKL